MKQNENGTVGGVSPLAFRQPEGGQASDEPLVLPPGTSLQRFKEFMRRIEDTVGHENATVVSSDAELVHESYLEPSKAHDVLWPSPISYTFIGCG